MEGKMKDIEMKKVNLQQAIVSLIVMWNELKSLLNFSENKSSTNMLHNKKYGNVVGEKLKEVDLNGPPDDLAEILEIEGKRLQKIMETNKASCKEKSREIEEKLREIEFNKSFIAERANELERKQKKIDDGITDLEVKKRIFAQEGNNIKAKLIEIEQRNWKLNKREEDINSREKKVKDFENLHQERCEELFGKMREIDSRKNEVEEDARKLESKRQELEEGFKELYSKKIEFAGISSSIAARFAEIEERNLNLNARTNELNSREMEVERSQVLCAKKSEETENKMREINSARERMEENAKELESKQKELENGFKELESKRMEFSKMTDGSADNNISSPETSKNPIKRKRTSLRRRRRTNTELPAPQVSQTVVNQNSDGTETFWTLCAHCQFIFQYTKLVVNKELTCTHCSNKFTAYELDAASNPPVNYSMVDLKYFPKTDVTRGDNGGGSGSVQQ